MLSEANPAAATTQTTCPLQPHSVLLPSSTSQEKAPVQQTNTHQVDTSITNSIDISHQLLADPSNTQTDSTTHTARATPLAHTAPAYTSAYMAHTHDPIAHGESHHAHHFSVPS